MAKPEDDDDDDSDEALEKRWTTRVLQFGSYKTAKLLARGGMGAAFRVTCKDHSARALKLALPSAGGEGDVFLEEVGAVIFIFVIKPIFAQALTGRCSDAAIEASSPSAGVQLRSL